MYNRVASKVTCHTISHLGQRGKDAIDDYIIIYGMFYTVVYQSYEYPDYRYFRNSVYRAASPAHIAPPLHVPPTRHSLDLRLIANPYHIHAEICGKIAGD